MGALDGVKVAEFAWGVAGPMSTKSLAAHGAEIVRVENSTSRFDIGAADTSGGRGGLGGVPNKRCISIDLKRPRGMEVAKRLIAWADIMTESFSPGTISRMGLSYEDVKKINPSIIMMSVSIQGQTGPYGKHPGFGVLASGITGLTHITGWPDRGPASPGAYSDATTPRFGGMILLAALEWRRRTGRGQYIDLSQLESALHLYGIPVFHYQTNKEETLRAGNRLSYASPHGVYRSKGEERYCALSVLNDHQWQAFSKAIGNGELSGDPRFETFWARKENEDALDAIVEEWTSQRAPEDVMNLLQSVGVPCAVVQNPADIYQDPQLQLRKHYIPLEHPALGILPLNRGECFILSETPAEPLRASSTLGDDNELVLKAYLGYSDTEYQELLDSGALS
jgi:benzylsuccinate CoA-transferase BbsF subunit